MAKVMKRRQRRISFIKSLPQELVVDIIAFVAASSLSDLSNMKLTCKEIHEAAGDNFVFQRASIEALPTIEWRTSSSQASLFLKQCESSGNPDAIYRRGMIEYFSRAHIQLGLDHLKRAADMGHLESTYVLGIILFSNKSTKYEGVKLLNMVKSKDGGIEKLYMRSKNVLREIWINNTIPLLESTCVNPTCSNGGMRGVPNIREWSWVNQCIEASFCSKACHWDYEINRFCNVLRGI